MKLKLFTLCLLCLVATVAFAAVRVSMTVVSDEEILQRSIGKRYRPAYATYDGVPASSHLCTVVIKTAAKLNAGQMDALETAIENINGVQVAMVMTQGPDVGSPTPPNGYEVQLGIEQSFIVSQVAE